MMNIAYQTPYGSCIKGHSEKVLTSPEIAPYVGKVDLIFTSPPFPLNRKKKYGNEQGEAYIEWLASYAPIFTNMLSPTGSIVLEVGNSWEPGQPIMSTLALEALLAFKKSANLHLCQQFIWNNPARLPSPVQWVNKERIRVKDSFTYLWWLSQTPRPKADNRRILTEYSSSMKKLQTKQRYNPGKRPSEYNIGQTSFFTDNGGAIPSNVITATNTHSSSPYLTHCKTEDIGPHPARMPSALVNYFIRFLTEEGDLVLDPFAGSNTTGSEADILKRRWLAIEPTDSYIEGSKGRFENLI